MEPLGIILLLSVIWVSATVIHWYFVEGQCDKPWRINCTTKEDVYRAEKWIGVASLNLGFWFLLFAILTEYR